MTRIAAADAKNRFAEIVERVESGEEVEITRYGHPVIRMVPIRKKRSPAELDALMSRVRDNAKRIGIKFDWAEWKAYRDEGRR